MLSNDLNKQWICTGNLVSKAGVVYQPGWIIREKEIEIEGKSPFYYRFRRSSSVHSNLYQYFDIANTVSLEYLIDESVNSIRGYSFIQILFRYYKDNNLNKKQSANDMTIKTLSIIKEKILKKCESFENDEQKKVFVLFFLNAITNFGYSDSNYKNDKTQIRALTDSVKKTAETSMKCFFDSYEINYSSTMDVINANVPCSPRNPGLADIKRSGPIKNFPYVVLADRISFFKKDDTYGILSFSFIDKDKIIKEEGRYHFKFESWFDFANYALRGNVPENCFVHFFDRDMFLNPQAELSTFMKNLIKRIHPSQEVILGNGLEEFSKNFKRTYLKQFKTLKEKNDFINNVFQKMLVDLQHRDLSHISLEEAKKKVDEYNSNLELEVKKVETSIVEEVPSNLDELMRFAELMSFEPNETNQDVEFEEDDNDDEEELTERETSSDGTHPVPPSISSGILEQITGVPPQGAYSGDIAQMAYSELMSRFGLNESELERPPTPDGLLQFINSMQSSVPEQRSLLLFGGTGLNISPGTMESFREMFYQPSENTTDPGYITGIDPAISPNIQPSVTTISVAEIREQLNNLANNTNV